MNPHLDINPYLDGLNASDLMTLGTAKDLGQIEADLAEARADYAQLCNDLEQAQQEGDLVTYASLQDKHTALVKKCQKLKTKADFAYSCAEYVAQAPHLAKYRTRVLGEPIEDQK